MMIWVCLSYSGTESVVIPLPQAIINREFFVEEVLADFDEERVQN
jgi:hypothetical protein